MAQTSEKFGFYLPSRDDDDIADINQISENFRIIDENLQKKEELEKSFEKKQDVLISGKSIKTLNGESILGEGNIKIEIDQTYNPQSENAQSGEAVAQAINEFSENFKTINGTSLIGKGNIEIEIPDTTVDQTYKPESENAQSGKAVAEGLANKKDKNTLSDFVGYTITDESPNGTVALMYVRDKNISGDVVIPDYIDGYPVEIPWGAFMNCALLKSVTLPKYASDISEMFIGCTSLETVVLQEGVNSITGATFSGCTSLKDIYYAGSKEQWESIQGVKAEFSEPLKNATVHYNHGTATKEYVLENAQTKFVSFLNGETIEIGNNTIYEATEKITNLTVTYPEENFIGSIIFTLADEGDITITLPESKYIGDVPNFANGETWELNIMNGVVVGGKVE